MLGVTSISLHDFILGSCSYLFNLSMQVFIGCGLFSMQSQGGGESLSAHSSMHNTVLIIEISVSVVVTVIMGYYATK